MDNNLSIFWFRRDLRLHDNHGLFKALSSSKKVMAIFIFDPEILGELNEDDKRVSLIYNRLKELNESLKNHGAKINIYHGKPLDVFISLFSSHKIDSVFANTDYEPYAIKRDNSIVKKAKGLGVNAYFLKDQLIFEKDDILSNSDTPYSVYTPFMKKWMSKFKISLTLPFLSQDHLFKLIIEDKVKQVDL